ncbi:type I secretion C-terminal target domain-containing protein [Phenylobacterium sp.]|uniref:type I secretion C-terminal target domain-containing protein n=2 Tax=Phenylobacterium sp. TaxID=1871053 RepID=UPI002811E63A|nr:type I secretion C-terminal target domain-containing protein [Phenylobacterium sp.]
MPGATPVININSIPGGHIFVNEAGLPNGSQAGQVSTAGAYGFTIKADDGIDDLTVGGYAIIRDGVVTPGSIALGPGVLTVTFVAATNSVGVNYEITSPHHSAQPGPQQRYGDFLSVPVVLTDKDGDRAESSLAVQIRDDEKITTASNSATATAGGPAATGNLITDGTPDKFTADGFGRITWVSGSSGTSATTDANGNIVFQGVYGVLTINPTTADYSYVARPDAPNGVGEPISFGVIDGDGDSAQSMLGITIKASSSSPTPGQTITSPGPNSTLTGGSGNDTITASQGGDTITTGNGADVLVLPTAPWSPHVVKDFALGADKLDFQALKNSYGGSDPVADKYIQFLDDGAGGTKVLYDWDGAGAQQQWPSYVLHLQGVSSQGLTWNALTNPSGAPPAPDDQPTIGKNPDGTGAITITVSDANISNGTSPDPAALVQRGAFHLEAADGVQNLYVAGKGVIVGGVFQAQTLTTAKGDTLAITGYDAATGAVSYEYTLKYAKEHPAPASGSAATPAIVDKISLTLDDKDGDRANGVITVTILDDKSITRDDTDAVTAGTTTVATGNVMTDASEGDSGDGDSGRDLRGADQANPYGLSSVNTGASNVGYMSNGQWTLAGQYGVLKLDIVGGYVYTPNAGVAAGSVDTFNYYLKDNDGTPPVSGKLTITFTGGGSGGGQTIVSPGPNSTITGGAGGDTITASQGGDTITGGAGADWFVFNKNPWSPHIVKDFHVGEDKLDLSAMLQAARYTGSDPVADKYVWLTDDGAGGLNVLFDWDGAGPNPQWPNFVAKLEGVSAAAATWTQLTGGGTGGGGDPPPPPPSPGDGQVITSPGPGSTLNGGAGADTLISSRGQDVLTGAGGADHFVFPAENWAPARITDFEDGVDKIDIRGMLDAIGYTGTDPFGAGYLKLIDDGAGGTKVLFDRDAAGTAQQWPNYVFQVEKVAPSQLGASDWIFQ